MSAGRDDSYRAESRCNLGVGANDCVSSTTWRNAGVSALTRVLSWGSG